MKTYDAECPCCGWNNKNLVLAETDGWMECEKCNSVTQVRSYMRDQEADRKYPKIYVPHMRPRTC